jgi:hypothetical protein
MQLKMIDAKILHVLSYVKLIETNLATEFIVIH